MKRALGAILALSVAVLMGVLLDTPTAATSALQSSFEGKYGAALTGKYSCDLCHQNGIFTELNSYGEDLVDALAESGGCLEFYAPTTHTLSYGRCEYMHAEGLFSPFTNKCTVCHGTTLEGLIAPSCYLCHGQRWTEAGPAPTGLQNAPKISTAIEDAFIAIESLDSDGDGYSNIEEINALTHPGDAGSFPGGMPQLKFAIGKVWQRDWVLEKDDLIVTLTPEGSAQIDTETFATLKSKAGELYTSNYKTKGDSVQVIFPKALLYTLFGSLDDKSASVTFTCYVTTGDMFSKQFTAKLKGKAPAILKGIDVKSDPRKWDPQKWVQVVFKGNEVANIDLNKPIYAIGPNTRVTLTDVKLDGKTSVTARLEAEDAYKLIGNGVEGAIYTIGFVGKSNGEALLVTYMYITAAPGDNCLAFSPPGSHSEAKTAADNCSYMHAPGADSPFGGVCNSCHGSDLKGSTIGPSCFLCHDDYWSTPPVQPNTLARGIK